MAEEKSAPKKEKAPKKEATPVAAGAETNAPAAEKPVKEKAPKAAKPAAEEAAPAEGAAPAAKPVELVGGDARQPTAEELLKEELGEIKIRKAKGSKNITSGVATVLASFNNTIVSITDPTGAVISWASAGQVGFKGSRKSTPFAAQLAAEAAARRAMEHGMRKVDVFVKGPGSGRETAIRSLQATGLEVGSISDVTPVPFNGTRPSKRRRV